MFLMICEEDISVEIAGRQIVANSELGKRRKQFPSYVIASQIGLLIKKAFPNA